MEEFMSKEQKDLLLNELIEINSLINKTVTSMQIGDMTSLEILHSFVNDGVLLPAPPTTPTTPSMNEEPIYHTQYITTKSLDKFDINSSTGNSLNARSRKPVNIILNLKKLILSLPESIQSASDIVSDNVVLKVVAGLIISQRLVEAFTCKITDKQAIALITLWEHCDYQNKISLEKGFEKVKDCYESKTGILLTNSD